MVVNEKYLKLFIVLFIAMFASLVYGFFLIKEDQDNNCWNKYSTEQEAIQNCEGLNDNSEGKNK